MGQISQREFPEPWMPPLCKPFSLLQVPGTGTCLPWVERRPLEIPHGSDWRAQASTFTAIRRSVRANGHDAGRVVAGQARDCTFPTKAGSLTISFETSRRHWDAPQSRHQRPAAEWGHYWTRGEAVRHVVVDETSATQLICGELCTAATASSLRGAFSREGSLLEFHARRGNVLLNIKTCIGRCGHGDYCKKVSEFMAIGAVTTQNWSDEWDTSDPRYL